MNHQWYAIYTKTNAEIKLRDSINAYSQQHNKDYETYLPMTTATKKWSDRTIRRPAVLFKNYLFVKHDDSGFGQIKKMPGFMFYVQFGQSPSVIPPNQVNLIRQITENFDEIDCCPAKLAVGDRVKVCKGPLANMEGRLVESRSNSKVAIEIKRLQQCVQVVIPRNDLVLLSQQLT